MKVNFGVLKNKKIIVPNNINMRPTTSIAKSIIFNSINNLKKSFDELIVLDLFAGTGLLGIECLSLGFKKVVFCDNNFDSIKTLKQNLVNFKIEEKRYKIIKNDFRRIISNSNQQKYDVIFLDPPFSVEKYFDESLRLISKNDILEKEGIIIMEKPYKILLKELINFKIIKTKKIGEKDILFLTLNNE